MGVVIGPLMIQPSTHPVLVRLTRLCFATAALTLLEATPALAASILSYSANSISNDVSVIDTASNSVIRTIPAGSLPLGIGVSPDGTRVYVTNAGGDQISIIDTAVNRVVKTVSVERDPSRVEFLPGVTRAFVSNYGSNSVSVIDQDSLVTNIAVAQGPVGLSVLPNASRLYVSGDRGTISIIDTTTNEVTGSILVTGRPLGLATHPAGNRLYVALSGNSRAPGTVAAIDTSTNEIVDSTPAGTRPLGLAILPDGSRLYVTNDSGHVTVINTAPLAVKTTVPVGAFPIGLAVMPDGGRVYVTNRQGHTVSVIDTATESVVATFPVGQGPEAIGIGLIPDTPTPTSTPTATYTPTPQPNGSACATDLQCVTGFCTDSFCCAARCGGADEYCNIPSLEGACIVVFVQTSTPTATTTPSKSHTPTQTPTPRTQGDECEEPSQCFTRHCSGGVCCDRDCNSFNESCRVPGFEGTCLGLDVPTLTPTETPTVPTSTPTPAATATSSYTITPSPTATYSATPTYTATATPSITPSLSPTFTPSPTTTGTSSPTSTSTLTPSRPPTDTPTHSPTESHTAARSVCTGDCDRSGFVTINELVRGVLIALGQRPLADCQFFDANADGKISIGELVAAVTNSLKGCQGSQ